jgi:hypothetical protein
VCEGTRGIRTTVAPMIELRQTMGSVKNSRSGKEREVWKNSFGPGTVVSTCPSRSFVSAFRETTLTFWRSNCFGRDSSMKKARAVATPTAIEAP